MVNYYIRFKHLGFRKNSLKYGIFEKEIITPLCKPDECKRRDSSLKTVRVEVFKELEED